MRKTYWAFDSEKILPIEISGMFDSKQEAIEARIQYLKNELTTLEEGLYGQPEP